MSTLLEVYEGMVKSAAEAEGQEAIATEQDAVTEERVEVLAKYAAASDDLLAEEYGEDYTEDDVIKLATMMIDHDVEQEDAMERVADFEAAGQIMARAFKTELDTLAESNDSE
jgi:hypothetical protein